MNRYTQGMQRRERSSDAELLQDAGNRQAEEQWYENGKDGNRSSFSFEIEPAHI